MGCEMGWRVLRRGPLSVAACWAGAAHPRRQKHREMPPPGASAPAFAATAEPASCPPSCNIQGKTRLQRVMERVLGGCAEGLCWWFVLKMGYSLHRFLISGPDLRIAARFCLFMPSCVHRFLISGPDLRIDARFFPFTLSCVHRFLISGLDLGIDARFSPFTPSFVHRFLISGPDLRIDAAENSSAFNGRSGDEFRVRF